MSESSSSENAPAPEKAPAPEAPDTTALNNRLDNAQTRLDNLRRSVKRSSIITVCIGGALLLLLTGYFTYGYVTILAFVNKPDELVSFVSTRVEDYLPEARRQAETIIKEDAPEWAEMASEELVASAPDIREKLEKLIFDQTEKLVQTLAGFTAKQFKTFLVEQRPMFEATIQELSSSDKVPEETMAELTEALENNLQVNMQEQADDLLGTLIALNEMLEKLADERDLTREESYLRRAMMILRRVHLEQVDPSFVGKKWTLAPKDGAAPVEEKPGKPDERPEPEPAKGTEPEEKATAPEVKEEAKPKATPEAKAKEEAKPDAKEEAKPKAEPAPEAKEEAKPKAETPAAEPAKAKADEPKPKTE